MKNRKLVDVWFYTITCVILISLQTHVEKLEYVGLPVTIISFIIIIYSLFAKTIKIIFPIIILISVIFYTIVKLPLF